MDFGKVMLINTSGAVTAAVVSIALALLGFSYMSFAWGWVSSAVVTGAIALMLGSNFRIFRPRLQGWRGMLAFGGYNGGTVVLYRFYESLPYLLLGRVLSADAAALYNRALMICQLPDKVILAGALSVALPAFSGAVRTGGDLKQAYLRSLHLITGLQWPALVMVALLADPLVRLLLGDQWHAVVPLVRIVAIAFLFSFSFELNYPVLVSVGAIRDVFLRAALIFPVSAAVVLGAALHGLEAVTWSLLAVIPFQALVSLSFIRRHIRVTWPEIASAVWSSAQVTALSLVGPIAVILLTGTNLTMSFPIAVAVGAAAAPGWILGLWVTRHDLLNEGKLAVQMVRGRRLPV
jgi:O-antigen/teichoic acid export membrane protein